MPIPSIEKTTSEEFDVLIPFQNEDPSITYEIQSIVSVTATQRDTGSDVTASLINSLLQSIDGDTLAVWVRNGTSGKYYDISAKVLTTSGQTLERQVEVYVTNKQSQ